MKALQSTDIFAIGRGHATYQVAFSDMNQLVPVGTTPPAAPKAGALWYNTNKGVTYVWDGNYWIG
jgi:hypothetical protein